jgi:hypothetical protein
LALFFRENIPRFFDPDALPVDEVESCRLGSGGWRAEVLLVVGEWSSEGWMVLAPPTCVAVDIFFMPSIMARWVASM